MLLTQPDDRHDDSDEPAGAVLLGSAAKRAYLYVNQSAERMRIERENAAQYGVQDMCDFVFVLDGTQVELTYAELKARLLTPNDLGNRRAAFGASELTDELCGNGTEVGAGDTAKGTT